MYRVDKMDNLATFIGAYVHTFTRGREMGQQNTFKLYALIRISIMGKRFFMFDFLFCCCCVFTFCLKHII